MIKDEYKLYYPVNDADNLWLQYYDQAYIDGTITVEDENKYIRISYKYTTDRNCYFEWNREEQRYYVVVNKKN